MTEPKLEEWQDQYLMWIKTHDRATTKRLSQDMAFIKTFEKGWKSRHPEIDALNSTIDDLALQKGILKAEIGRLGDENAALKAEVERLRKPAKNLLNHIERNYPKMPIPLFLIVDLRTAMADKGE